MRVICRFLTSNVNRVGGDERVDLTRRVLMVEETPQSCFQSIEYKLSRWDENDIQHDKVSGF